MKTGSIISNYWDLIEYNVHHIRHSELKASLILTAYGIIFGLAYDVSGDLPIPEKYKPLPERKNIIVTRNNKFKDNGATVVNSIEKAIEVSRSSEDEEVFIIGGGEIYKLGFKYVDKLYITEIYAEVDGNTYFPEWDKKKWMEISRISHPSDEKHQYSFDYVIYKKNE